MKLKSLLLLLCVCLSSGCTAWKSVPVTHAPYKLHRGDVVEVGLRGGGKMTAKVKSVDEAQLTTKDGQQIDFANMKSIKRKKTSVTKTGTAVVGTAASATVMSASVALAIVGPVLGIALALALL